MSKTFKTNATIVNACTQRIRALEANIPANSDIAIGGTTYKVPEIVAIYQASLDTRAALIKSRAQVRLDLLARTDAEAKRLAIEDGLEAWVVGQFGHASTAATELGYAPAKKAKRTAEVTANAVLLAQATREARHTVGKKEKLKIKGSLPIPNDPAAGDPPAPPAPSTAKANGAQASAHEGAPLTS